uniref:FHA domain-containing protein n=1 Tax=Heterorhabditis bacteriophora TaxID=37862 RepID=A0A1I7XED9_HETBA
MYVEQNKKGNMTKHGGLGLLPGGGLTVVPPTDWERIERSTELTGDIVFDESRALRAAAARENAGREWSRIVVQPVTGIVNDSQMNAGALATLRGRVVRYVIRSDRVVLGRSTPKVKAEVNLAMEGPALKVSRKQAVIERQPATGEFMITNLGRRPIFVDGKSLIQNGKTHLVDNSIIQIALIRLVFRVGP